MSPRPRKPRRCGQLGNCQTFKPTGAPLSSLPVVEIMRDELETLRLCDLHGLTQEEAGERMGVSRGTVQRTVKQARRKVAEALINGAALMLPKEDRR